MVEGKVRGECTIVCSVVHGVVQGALEATSPSEPKLKKSLLCWRARRSSSVIRASWGQGLGFRNQQSAKILLYLHFQTYSPNSS